MGGIMKDFNQGKKLMNVRRIIAISSIVLGIFALTVLISHFLQEEKNKLASLALLIKDMLFVAVFTAAFSAIKESNERLQRRVDKIAPPDEDGDDV